MNTCNRFGQTARQFYLQTRCSQHTKRHRKPISDVIVKRSRGEDDWRILRGIFVKAFQRYPLFKYFVPDSRKRPEFLKRYFEALYDVIIRSNTALLFSFKQSGSSIPVGGAILERVSFKGDSWSTPSDEKFAEAYDRFGLRNVDNEATEKLLKYEDWESDNILNKIRRTGVPVWHTMFIGIDPIVACTGCGFKSFDYGTNILYEIQQRDRMLEKQKRIEQQKSTHGGLLDNEFEVLNNVKQLSLHSNAHRLSHSVASYEIPYRDTNNRNTKLNANILDDSNSFLLMGTSHCERAVKFHNRNEMRSLTKLTYAPENDLPIDVHVLMADLLNSGKMPFFRDILNTTSK